MSRESTELGVPMLEAKHVPYDDEEWFRREYDAGKSAVLTAQEWINNNQESHPARFCTPHTSR